MIPSATSRFQGVAFGLVLGISPTISTIAIVLIAAIFLEYLRTVYKSFMEIGTAILMSTGLAVSLIVMSKGKSSSSMSLDQYLFGSIVTISEEQVIFPFCHCGGCFDFDLPLLRPMYILTFDEDTAFVDGLPSSYHVYSF